MHTLLLIPVLKMKALPDTLCIDIGGTGVKLIVVDAKGTELCDRQRCETPHPGTPQAIIGAIEGLTKQVPEFDRIAVGFPGVVRNGIIETAANLDLSWPGTNLSEELEQRLNKPTRVANDADVQGYACVSGKGVEMVLTLGTGMGSALFADGCLVPNLELAHHHFKKDKTYEDYVGRSALESIGIREQILSSISNFEPRVNNVDANVTIGADTNDMFITVEYDIVGLPVPTQSVDVLLFPARL